MLSLLYLNLLINRMVVKVFLLFIPGLDFRLRTKSLVFNKLESNVEVKNVIVNIKEDNLSEGSENFSIVLDSGSGSPCSQQKLPVTILEV